MHTDTRVHSGAGLVPPEILLTRIELVSSMSSNLKGVLMTREDMSEDVHERGGIHT